ASLPQTEDRLRCIERGSVLASPSVTPARDDRTIHERAARRARQRRRSRILCAKAADAVGEGEAVTGAAPRTAGVAQEPADVAGAEDAGGRRVSALLERVIAQAARLAESATGSADVRGAATAAGVGRGTRAAVERAAEERLTEPAVYEAPERNV